MRGKGGDWLKAGWSLSIVGTDPPVAVIGLNSCQEDDHRQDRHYGWLSDSIDRVESELAKLDIPKVAVFHHNAIPIPSRDNQDFIRNWKVARERLYALGVILCLHGHIHDSDFNVEQSPFLAGAGTICLADVARPKGRLGRAPLQYNVVEVTKEGSLLIVRIHARVFIPKGGDDIGYWQGNEAFLLEVQDTASGRLSKMRSDKIGMPVNPQRYINQVMTRLENLLDSQPSLSQVRELLVQEHVFSRSPYPRKELYYNVHVNDTFTSDLAYVLYTSMGSDWSLFVLGPTDDPVITTSGVTLFIKSKVAELRSWRSSFPKEFSIDRASRLIYVVGRRSETRKAKAEEISRLQQDAGWTICSYDRLVDMFRNRFIFDQSLLRPKPTSKSATLTIC